MTTKRKVRCVWLGAAISIIACGLPLHGKELKQGNAFPAKVALETPADRRLSAAMARMYDVWNPHEDRGNDFFSNFKYSRLEGFSREPNVSRRDPSKIIRANGRYYVYCTCRRTAEPPAGPAHATDTIPSYDWDLAEIWYATSADGFRWQEQGPAVRRPAKGQFGWRSNCTPDILAWNGRYYLYYQAYSEIIRGGDICPVTVAVADSPDGPFHALGRPVIEPGGTDDWDCACVQDPFPIIYRGKVYQGRFSLGGRSEHRKPRLVPYARHQIPYAQSDRRRVCGSRQPRRRMMLSVSPKADGTIPDEQKKILLELGNWLEVNGEGIYGTRKWKIETGGPTEKLLDTAGTKTLWNFAGTRDAGDVRFTQSDNRLFAFVLDCPQRGEVLIRALRTAERVRTSNQIQRICMLGSDARIDWERRDDGL